MRSTIRIHYREDIKIKAVDSLFYIPICAVVPKQVVRDVLGDHGRNPFSGMDGAKKNHGGIYARSGSPKYVNALDWSSFERLASNDGAG